jgi:hypothetical protein
MQQEQKEVEPLWIEKIPIIKPQILNEIKELELLRKERQMRKKQAFQAACDIFCNELAEICTESILTLVQKRLSHIVIPSHMIDYLLHEKVYHVDEFSFQGHILMYGYHLLGNKHYLARNKKTFANYKMIKPFVKLQKAIHQRSGLWLVNKSDSNKSHRVILVISVSKPELEPPLWHALNNTYDQIYKASSLYKIPEMFPTK